MATSPPPASYAASDPMPPVTQPLLQTASMLRSNQKSHKKTPEVESNLINLSWTNNVVRFSEKHQLIDVLDVFGTIYGSVTSATSAQSRWFKEGENTDKTASSIGCDASGLVYKVRWAGEPRQRLALSIKNMSTFLENCVPSLPRSKDIAEILGADPLTAELAQDRPIYIEESARPEAVQPAGGPEKQHVPNLSLSLDVVKFMSSRQMQVYCENMVKSDSVMRSLKTSVAEKNYGYELALIEKKRSAEFADIEERAASNARKRKVEEDLELEAKTLELKINTLELKIKAAERLGMHDDASRLRRQLLETC